MNKRTVLWSLTSLLVMAAMLLSACGAAATTAAPATAAPATAAPATAAPATAAPATAAPTATTAPTAAVPTCGTAPVVLNGYFETGFDLPFKLSAEFTKEYPNVTWNISQDQFGYSLVNSSESLKGRSKPVSK